MGLRGPRPGKHMCRFVGYLGPPVSLEGLLYGPPFGLWRQAWAPRCQQFGNVNADGWGVGWYDRAIRAEPARYRTVTPIWADRNFAEIAPLLSSDCAIAAIRDASPGIPVDQSSTAPFTSGQVLFAHNGLIERFREGASSELRRRIGPRRESEIIGGSDSEVVFALLLGYLDKLSFFEGATVGSRRGAAGTGGEARDLSVATQPAARWRGLLLAAAIRETIDELRSVAAGRFNLVVSDGGSMVASAAGDRLFALSSEVEGSQVTQVASEPFDDDPAWFEVPPEHLLIATHEEPAHLVAI